MLFAWLIIVFILGAVIGSFLNVCIHRLPLEKSILWPNSRCSSCLQPVRWLDNIPLVSYWLLRGRCRTCRARFSIRYFAVELLTGLAFTGMFYLEIVANVHGFILLDLEKPLIDEGLVPLEAWGIFIYHAALVSCLIVAAFCDLEYREIPLTVTIPGTMIGLIGAVVFPWPWPNPVHEANLQVNLANLLNPNLVQQGLVPWPVWLPLPGFAAPGGNWQTGLATAITGALAGTFMLRMIGFIFKMGLGVDALGLGDADLMMMAGAFLGWQVVVVSFFVAALPGLLFGIVQMIFVRDRYVPFGPALAVGILVTLLAWQWIGPFVQVLLFNGTLAGLLLVFCVVGMLLSSFLFRLFRRGGGEAMP